MVVDGSFCLDAELDRFLARCPNLRCVNSFSSLLEKGNTLAEDEVVDSIAAVFLYSTYTIPVIGCFRRIAGKILDKVVEVLRLVPNLGFNIIGAIEDFHGNQTLVDYENLDGVKGASLIEFYSKSGRGLDLHELACFAFCRALDLVPSLKGCVQSYYEFAPPPFIRIPKLMPKFKCSAKAAVHLLHIVRTSYRTLLAEPEYFSSCWNWCCFLDLLQNSEGGCLADDTELGKNVSAISWSGSDAVSDIMWCGIQILSVILKLPNKTIASCGLRAEEDLACLLRWCEFCCDTSVEKAGWYSVEPNKFKSSDGDTCFHEEDDLKILSSKLLNIKPLKRSRRLETRDINGDSCPFVMTSAVKKSCERVVLAVRQKWPVLLYGPGGSGKTALVNKLASDSGNRVLSIHMDDQIDARTLVGSYVCTEQPGEFRWQPGSLTQAAVNGLWVVFENLDQAPSDVQSVLLPILEGGRSIITGHGETIRVAEGFRILSTISSCMPDLSTVIEGRKSLSALWRRVMLRSPGSRDLIDVVTAWYPDLEPIAEKLSATLESVNQLSRFCSGISGVPSLLDRFSTRDLLRWCKRISGLGYTFNRVDLTASMRTSIFLEAIDIFSASSGSRGDRQTIVESIAKMWDVSVPPVDPQYRLDKPIFRDSPTELQIGRITLQHPQVAHRNQNKPFVAIRSSLHALERIACSVRWNEPVLLVGETGTGKTTLVQSLATRLGHRLTVLNLSQQSDVADLLGGFKPVDPQSICIPLFKEFEDLFSRTFPLEENKPFLTSLLEQFKKKNWEKILRRFGKGVKMVVRINKHGSGSKRKRPLAKEVLNAWKNFALKVEIVHKQVTASSGMLFSFVEGVFVTALRNGDWILLDEVNLAPAETLQRIVGVLDGENGSFCLAERGDIEYLYRHPNFRIFACMNPATDAGKRDLPYSLRSRFTEYFVDDVLDDDDLTLFVSQFIDDSHLKRDLVDKVVRFYKAVKKEAEERLQDGANQKAQYSLRSLYRALEYVQEARKRFQFQDALYDGFCLLFMTSLDEPSSKVMNRMIVSYLLGKQPPDIPFEEYLAKVLQSPKGRSQEAAVSWEKIQIHMKSEDVENYVLTESVRKHLKNLARAMLIKRYPVLLQGPTSSGKTSLVKYLAAITGHEFVRINNHEHTDLQEYLGSYITDASGKLVFHEGALVKAVRNGHWIVLDELNLAPSDVLEALNRLLDDNRELFVPELSETIHAHPDFMLFATQNPPIIYGGRKMLSRAFRNRFIEIHVDEIPEDELSTILMKTCKVPESYAKKMVEVMKELQLVRQSSKVFAGKHGFITPRDLFRWADRFRADGSSYDDLAKDGYLLLAGRLRDENEKTVVQEVLERHLRVRIMKDELHKQGSSGMAKLFEFPSSVNSENIIWTRSMRRLYFLVKRCYRMREPVLLVGETGGGKTTVCQLLSLILGSKLHILNCHQYTETSDFIGGFYPIRERSRIMLEYKNLIEQILSSKAFTHFPVDGTISSDINQASSTLRKLGEISSSYKGVDTHFGVSVQDLVSFEQMRQHLSQLHQKWKTIFTWQDGPLVQAMKNGDLFLVDEISLADDSVLERLNSVLEPERKLSLAEKGGSDLEKITAHPNFFLFATMNPAGDYGKKELSPALRSRFTEIWVPPVSDLDELRSIAVERFSSSKLHALVDPMLNFWEWFNQLQTGRMLTVRDLLSWVAFINTTEGCLQPDYAFLHGAFLVLLDGISLGTSISKNEAAELTRKCLDFLVLQLKGCTFASLGPELSRIENYGWGNLCRIEDISRSSDMQLDNFFGVHPFYIEKGDDECEVGEFEFLAPTTHRNVLRVLRAMQVAKPVLLEGSPGVGKTSLIVALGKFSGHKVVRINLSEQTDMMDLLGSDLPVESEEGMQFAWSDGILVQALKEGSWVLLDELNLAPQSVLEGLNAILDHRAEVFIPELGLSFKCPPSFRVFACQNPSYQGGGRKGLPKSFLNRFTKVYVDELAEDDYHFICRSLFPSIPGSVLTKLIQFNKRLYEETMLHRKFAQNGAPWEFNLRDVIRSCQIIQGSPDKSECHSFLNVVYVQRMRTAADRREVLELYQQIFGVKPSINPYPRVQLNDRFLVVGNAFIKRNNFQSTKTLCTELKILPDIRNSLEAAAQSVQQQWLCILIGQASCGKTSLVRLLAQLSGNVLNEINLSSATDISELIGCFEQYNAFYNFQSVVAQVDRYLKDFCSQNLESSPDTFLKERRDLVAQWLSSLPNLNFYHVSRSGSTDDEKWSSSLSMLIEIIEYLRLDMDRNMSPVSWSYDDLDRILLRIRKLQEVQYGMPSSAKFGWAAGLLIKAMEHGEWVLLEDANLCNPTVLDRINSLAESNGSITVNECGNVDGKPLILHPHPDFRMFLTVNPSFGEVSRAMRNRGVEIAMMKPYWLFEKDRGYRSKEIEMNDIKRFLALSDIPRGLLIDSMAKAHLYARDEGLRHNVDITYMELGRWVQLFQQLLTSGNHLMWSLQRSWEHTYISSFGESEGWDIVNHAKISYLSIEFSSSLEWSLCLPGGWPLPLKLRDFVWYSKETCVRQNCMYLESLGSQYASFERSLCQNQGVNLCLSADSCKAIYLMDSRMLQQIMYPKCVNVGNSSGGVGLDLALAGKMLLFSADWTVEQATENDLNLYLLWFSWFNCKLQPYSEVFGSFLALFRKELRHPIWECIFRSRHEMMSHQGLDHRLLSLPILALEFVDLVESKGMSVSSAILLHNAINCVGLLRRSLWQWHAERMHAFSDQSEPFKPVLKSLRILEKGVLKVIVKSPSFDFLFRTYNDLLEEHISWWNSIVASQLEHQLVHWHRLIKNVMKLQDYCPQEVKFVAVESRNLNCLLSWSLNSSKSMLWAYGGHPLLPRSADVYYKLQQLFHFSDLLCPLKVVLSMPADACLVETAVSTNPELRLLAMQGVSMASHILDKYIEDEGCVVNHLDQIYKMLLKRFEYEKEKLEANVASEANKDAMAYATSCCILFPEMICTPSGFRSWLETVPMVDQTSLFLDLSLLQELSKIVLASGSELQPPLSSLYDDLQFTMHFSLNFSSRSPSDLLTHQKLLWILDAWTSVDGDTKISSYILEMWFRWHSLLWNGSSVFAKGFPRGDARKLLLPDMISLPIKVEIVQHILESTYPVKDYPVHCLKIRVGSCIVWQSFISGINLQFSFLSLVRPLLQQIILAHRKSFDPEKFAAIKSIYLSLQENIVKESDIQAMVLLLMSSTHQKFTSLLVPFIEPLLKDVYLLSSSNESLYLLGCAWLRLGALRFHLLLSCDDVDPAVKCISKYLRLVEKISSLELEMKVRQQCDYLAGSLSKSKAEDQRCSLFEKLEVERRRAQRKIIFRADHGKFRKLKQECDEFLKLISASLLLMESSKHIEFQHFINQASNWQLTANCFIDRLSDEYIAYVDIIQPIQVAIYEMKLGLSLVASCILQRDFLDRIQEDTINPILDAIYLFMRFPDGPAFRASVEINLVQPEVPLYTLYFGKSVWAENLGLLEKLIPFVDSMDSMKLVSPIHLKAPLYQSLLARVVNFVCSTHLLDNATFMLMDQIFSYFASVWMDMKVQVKIKKDNDVQQFKFKPREFKMEDICEIDLSSLSDTFAGDTFLEWKGILHEEDTVKVTPAERGNSQEWDLIPESVLNKMVHIHNQLFGSTDLAETPGVVKVSDADRLLSFIESYTLGAKMVKGLNGISTSFLDAKLCPEHALRLCLEHQLKLPISDNSALMYNFYKDSNVSAIAGMVKLLTALQERALFLLNEKNEHAGLRKILDIIQMLLAIPSGTPLAKALSGLQFLYGRVKMLNEDGFKLPLNDELEPVLALAHLWQKMEYDSWQFMLDEVQSQFEMNAAKLWFPLYSVLHLRTSKDVAEYNQYTVQSLEEFIRTSNLGEFRNRLKLILAFHGQVGAGISLKCYSSPFQIENRKILYNVFGFYVQCLPIIMEHIEASRRNIEKELQELLKLCRWERSEKLLSIENSKRNRQKMKKLIEKYTDVLQQPVMLVLNQEVVARVVKTHNPCDSSDKDKEMLRAAHDISQLGHINRAQWYASWQAKVDSALQNSHQEPESAQKECAVSKSSSPAYHDEWNKAWDTLEQICRTTADSRDIWKGEGKTLMKKRALGDLLKLLENSGLSRHKSTVLEEQFKDIQPSWWFLLPSYDVSHLLLKRDSLLLRKASYGALNQAISSTSESLEEEWKGANEYYFKSLASVQHLQQICVNVHKDFRDPSDNIQVAKSSSFLQHLIAIQQEQRAAAYDFSERINQLADCMLSLSGVYKVSDSSCQETLSELSTNQHALLRCMWHQKEVFDSLCALSYEETLLLRTVKGVHMDTCQNVEAAADRMLALLEEFFTSFRASKAKLDDYLLGNGGERIKIATSMCPPLISKEMELHLIQNFKIVKEFQERLRGFQGKDINKSSVGETLIHHFEDIIEKVKSIEKELYTSAESGNDSRILPKKRKSSTIMLGDNDCSAKNLSEYEDRFTLSVGNIYRHMTNEFQKLGYWSDSNATSEASMEEITSWKGFFQSLVADLQLDYLCKELTQLVFYAGKLADLHWLSSQVTMQLKQLQLFLDLIFYFSDGILHDFLAVHKKVGLMTHTLAKNFASLFSEGYGTPVEEQVDDNENHMTQDASGTGMGEGVGVKDVSDQITDEDQLLGASGKREEDASKEVPSKNNKGIEMEQDFDADAFSMSGDSEGDGDDDDCDDNKQLESAMGKTGDDGEVIDEKHWDKENDGNHDGTNEKYESGPSVKDGDLSGRELRAKEDSAAMPDDLEEGNLNKSDANDEVDLSKDSSNNAENLEAIDKENAIGDPADLELDEPNQIPEDTAMEVNASEDPVEGIEGGENDEHMNDEGAGPTDEILEEAELNQVGETTEVDATEGDEEHGTADLTKSGKDVYGQGNSSFMNDHLSITEAAAQPMDEPQEALPRYPPPEEKWSFSSGMQNDLAPSDNASQIEIMLGNSSKGEKLANIQQESQVPQQDLSSFQKNQPNPMRNVGDALEAWKERVKVSADLPDNDKETLDDMVDGDADEYGFTSEFEKGIAQALGPAMPDQVEQRIDGDKPDGDGPAVDKKNSMEMELERREDTQVEQIRSHTVFRSKFEDQIQNPNPEKLSEERILESRDSDDIDSTMPMESFISLKKSYLSENMDQLSKLSSNDLGKANGLMEISTDLTNNAGALWRKYELQTMRLSQELAEQLRLVMDPTLASKLQGDFRTGKRINMKKVIPYIASHYRKDKIWLRRTKPNKRDYQVVIAVDDSRSMSESHCGDVAIEALVAVCRAMSQLEVGKFAVASFGGKGNIRLLHDFDRPFTGEAGIKMISSLTFKQENTITDEPMVELLTYLNNMLDQAVGNARLPSGQNPLQQLVLIIADGRFHEKEKLRRYVRDALNRKCMVAFLLLDSPEESIMELMEASFEGGNMRFTKYLDSFPFPYYIVLRNIEALPRTLADLLRQWFELMQYSRD